MNERSTRKELVGEVVSTKMQKTVVVKVTRKIRHPRYQKLVEKWKKYFAHNEDQSIQVGDEVSIMETRPLSKNKRWRVVETLKRKETV